MLKGSSKERMMGSTVRDLGNTIKEAKNFLLSKKGASLFHDHTGLNEDGTLDEELESSARLLEEEDDGLVL
jgi:hypothetical protein